MNAFENKIPDCPNGHGIMPLTRKNNTVEFKGISITYEKECFTCPECGLEASTIKQAAAIQKAIIAGYEKIKAMPVCRPPVKRVNTTHACL